MELNKKNTHKHTNSSPEKFNGAKQGPRHCKILKKKEI